MSPYPGIKDSVTRYPSAAVWPAASFRRIRVGARLLMLVFVAPAALVLAAVAPSILALESGTAADPAPFFMVLYLTMLAARGAGAALDAPQRPLRIASLVTVRLAICGLGLFIAIILAYNLLTTLRKHFVLQVKAMDEELRSGRALGAPQG